MAVITASDRTYTLHGTTRLTFADAVARILGTCDRPVLFIRPL